jgi:hypothetical protein
MSLSLLALTAALIGCGGEEPKTQPAEPTPAVQAPAAPPEQLKLDELKAAAQNITLVPSPMEMQKALEQAGVQAQLEKAVQRRTMKMDVTDTDVIAVRTGVVLADALLTVKTAPPDQLVERLKLVKDGMQKLRAGNDIQSIIDELIGGIQNVGSGSRDKLVQDLDEMHGAIIPELEYEAGPQVVPLIQAGSWLEGSNLLASAILDAKKPEVGNDLLRQPQIADYFLKYVQLEGRAKAPDEVVKQLNATLTKLKEISSKPSLVEADVKEVKAQTDTVLGML